MARRAPVLLDEVLATANRHIVQRAIRRRARRTEIPSALVGVFSTTRVIPGIEVRVGCGFDKFVSDNRRSAISTGVAIGARGLIGAAAQTAIGIANERVFDVLVVDRRMRVPAAVLVAKAARCGDVFRGEHQIKTIFVTTCGAEAIGDRGRHDRLDVRIGQTGFTAQVAEVLLARERDGLLHGGASAIGVRRIDRVIGRAADAADQVVHNALVARRRTRTTIKCAVPNHVHFDARAHDFTAVIRDAARRVARRTCITPDWHHGFAVDIRRDVTFFHTLVVGSRFHDARRESKKREGNETKCTIHGNLLLWIFKPEVRHMSLEARAPEFIEFNVSRTIRAARKEWLTLHNAFTSSQHNSNE